MDVNISGVLDIKNDAEVGNNNKQSLWYYSIYDVFWCFGKIITFLFFNIFFRTNTVKTNTNMARVTIIYAKFFHSKL